MGTPEKVVLRRNSHRIINQWWLIKADSDFHGKRLGIGGFTSHEKQGIRCFLSAPIVERRDTVTVKTADGITISVHGQLSRSRTLENGFSNKVCDHFVLGFPYDWEEFAALSYDKDEMATPECDESSMLKNIFDDILQQNDGDAVISTGVSIPDKTPSTCKRKMAKQKRDGDGIVEGVQHSGPLTRSRTRLRDK